MNCRADVHYSIRIKMNRRKTLTGVVLSVVTTFVAGFQPPGPVFRHRHYGYGPPWIHPHNGHPTTKGLTQQTDGNHEDNGSNNPIVNNEEDAGNPIAAVMKLASAHFSSQALYTAIRLKIPDILGDQQLSLEDISSALGGDKCNQDALLRTLRLLTTNDVLQETQRSDGSVAFSLTTTGKLFMQNGGMASCVQHWMEQPLWNAWLELPGFIQDGPESRVPFERANGISSDFWYNKQDHPESLQHANNFVRLIHTQEVNAVVNGFDWSVINGKELLDIGGHYGQVVGAIATKFPEIDCYCLDLPSVVEMAPSHELVTMISGDILDPSTIPACDAILMKHFLDRCMWTEDQTLVILQTCFEALNANGTCVIAEAVFPDYGKVTKDNELELHMDALYMLVGREGQRTESEWRSLSAKAGFVSTVIRSTGAPSCSLIILRKSS